MLPCPAPPAEILKIFRAEAPAGPLRLGSASQRPIAMPAIINTVHTGEWEYLRVPGEVQAAGAARGLTVAVVFLTGTVILWSGNAPAAHQQCLHQA